MASGEDDRGGDVGVHRDDVLRRERELRDLDRIAFDEIAESYGAGYKPTTWDECGERVGELKDTAEEADDPEVVIFLLPCVIDGGKLELVLHRIETIVEIEERGE